MEALLQVVQEGSLTRVGVQENKILDAHAIPGRQGGLHVPQHPVTPLVQALFPIKKTSVASQGNRVSPSKPSSKSYNVHFMTPFFYKIYRNYFIILAPSSPGLYVPTSSLVSCFPQKLSAFAEVVTREHIHTGTTLWIPWDIYFPETD